MMKVTLVNPQVISTAGWNSKLGMHNTTNIRFSLAYFSSCLKKRGHEVNLIDTRFLKNWEEYKKLIKKQRPDFLGVTMTSCEYRTAIKCCELAKNVHKKIKTCVGGIHPTILPNKCSSSSGIDYVLKGEGETSFPKLVENPDKFPSIFFGKTPDLNSIPFPDRELWPNYEKCINLVSTAHPYMFKTLKSPIVEVITARGCPHKCRFCCGPGEKNLYTKEKNGIRIPFIRQRSVQNVIGELLSLHEKYKYKSIIFWDDQFILSPRWIKRFCKEMHNSGLVEKGVQWWAESRPDIIVKNEDLIKEMKDAGLKIMGVGYESFSQGMLDWLGKETTVDENWKAAKILKDHKITVHANFLFGIPFSDGKWYREHDIKNIKAFKKIKPKLFSCSILVPVFGSSLFNFCKEKNLLLIEDPEVLGLRKQKTIKGVDYCFLEELIASVTQKRLYTLKKILKKVHLLNIAKNIRRKNLT